MALMHILAKCVLDEKQLKAREALKKELPIKGIEILLRDNDFQDISETLKRLVELGNEYEILGLETAISTIAGGKKIAINPISPDPQTRKIAREFLARYVSLANRVQAKTSACIYAQWQLLGAQYNAEGKPSGILSHEEELKKLQEYHRQLQSRSSVPIQIENGVPINPNGKPTKPEEFRHDFVMTRMEDYQASGIPAALDVNHLALTFNCWANSEPDGNLYTLRTKDGTFSFQQTNSDTETGMRIRKAVKKGATLQKAVTDELISTILAHNENIDSLQFANAGEGFGTDEREQGQYDGLIDMQRLFKEAIVPANIPYLIPEYHEADYNNPILQRKALTEVASWIGEK